MTRCECEGQGVSTSRHKPSHGSQQLAPSSNRHLSLFLCQYKLHTFRHIKTFSACEGQRWLCAGDCVMMPEDACARHAVMPSSCHASSRAFMHPSTFGLKTGVNFGGVQVGGHGDGRDSPPPSACQVSSSTLTTPSTLTPPGTEVPGGV